MQMVVFFLKVVQQKCNCDFNCEYF